MKLFPRRPLAYDFVRLFLDPLLQESYDFRNTHIAHEKAQLESAEATRTGLKLWIDTLTALHGALH